MSITCDKMYYSSKEYHKLSNGKKYFLKLKRGKRKMGKNSKHRSSGFGGVIRGEVERNTSLLASAVDAL